MCDVIGELARAGVSRRALLAGAAGMAGLAGGVAAAPAAQATGGPADRPAAGRPAPHGQRHRTSVALLGTAGGPPYWTDTDRNGTASAVVVGDRYYLVDAGHGVVRQAREARLGSYTDDQRGPLDALAAVFLTHLHSDHVVDLNNILTLGLTNGLQTHVGNPVQIWGPGDRGTVPPLFGPPPEPPVVAPDSPTPGTAQMVDLLVAAFATDYNDRARDNRQPVPAQMFTAHDVPVPTGLLADPDGEPAPRTPPFPVFEDDRVRVSATLVQHAPIFPALAYRFDTDDGSVTFSGDTSPHPNLVELATGTDVLVHEVIDRRWVEGFLPEPRDAGQQAVFAHLLGAHTEVTDVGTVAEQAGAGTLVLNHLLPGNWPEHLWLDAQQGYSGRLVVGRDLDRIGVGRRERTAHLHGDDR